MAALDASKIVGVKVSWMKVAAATTMLEALEAFVDEADQYPEERVKCLITYGGLVAAIAKAYQAEVEHGTD